MLMIKCQVQNITIYNVFSSILTFHVVWLKAIFVFQLCFFIFNCVFSPFCWNKASVCHILYVNSLKLGGKLEAINAQVANYLKIWGRCLQFLNYFNKYNMYLQWQQPLEKEWSVMGSTEIFSANNLDLKVLMTIIIKLRVNSFIWQAKGSLVRV